MRAESSDIVDVQSDRPQINAPRKKPALTNTPGDLFWLQHSSLRVRFEAAVQANPVVTFRISDASAKLCIFASTSCLERVNRVSVAGGCLGIPSLL